MMKGKLVQYAIFKCNACPHCDKEDDDTQALWCFLVEDDVPGDGGIPEWCPLQDYELSKARE